MPMTPDEVVNTIESIKKEISLINSYFEDCMEVVLHKNDIKLPPITIEALTSAISLLQDYQKLRERIDREKIESIINDNCRYIADEGKVMFIYGNTAQAIITYLQQPTEH